MLQLLAPEILAETQKLSAGVCAGGLVLGLSLWLLGWWAHRFWVVLITTVAAGTWGLEMAPALQTQPLLTGLLCSLAAGLLALHLFRVLAFASGGMASFIALQGLGLNWVEPLLGFLAGGLLGLVLFRLWTMALTASLGTLLLAYSGLSLAGTLGTLDASAWASQQASVFNWVCAGLAAAGFLFQVLWNRRRGEKKGKKNGNGKASDRGDSTPILKIGASLFRKAG